MSDIPKIYFGVKRSNAELNRAAWDMLGNPEYVECGADEREKAFIVGRGERDVNGAKFVYVSAHRDNVVLSYRSSSIDTLFDALDWVVGKCYCAAGAYDAVLDAIVFNLKEAGRPAPASAIEANAASPDAP